MTTPTTRRTTSAALALGDRAWPPSPRPAPPCRPRPPRAGPPPTRRRIHPGVQMYTEGAQCTANFVFTDRERPGLRRLRRALRRDRVRRPTPTAATTASLPLGTRVRFAEGGSLAGDGETVGRGRLAYSSWLTMQRRGTRSANTCAYNDLALVRVDAGRSSSKVNPSVPFWGGPVGLDTDGIAAGRHRATATATPACGPASTELGPKQALSLGEEGGGWTPPSTPRPRASPATPAAASSTRTAGRSARCPRSRSRPWPASNGVGDLRRELRFARKHVGHPRAAAGQGHRGVPPRALEIRCCWSYVGRPAPPRVRAPA